MFRRTARLACQKKSEYKISFPYFFGGLFVTVVGTSFFVPFIARGVIWWDSKIGELEDKWSKK